MIRSWKPWLTGLVLALTAAGSGFGIEAAGAASAATTKASAAGGKSGGTLTMMGQSDVFNVDPVSAYYTVSNMLERMFTRQLVTYPAPTASGGVQPVVPDVAKEVPTTANGGITGGGKTITFHLKKGVDWDTKPARQVTAADFVREFKMLCNPASPVGAPGYYTSTIVGMSSYCTGFEKVKASVAAISAYVSKHALPGVVASNELTLTFHLTHPATDFMNIMAMGFSSARPVEYMSYVPDSAQLRQHTISDGPYQISSYTADKGFTLVRNPAWKASTDKVRKAYVDKVVITEGLSSANVQQQLQAGTADMEWDVTPPTSSLPGLESTHNAGLVIGKSYVDLGVYLALNQYDGPMTNKLVRQAVAVAVDKKALVQLNGGPTIAGVTNQLLMPGSTGYVSGFNGFPQNTGRGNAAAAKALLKQSGEGNVTVKLLYSTTDPMPAEAQAVQASLEAAGFTVKLVPATQSDFYGKYLEDPTTGKADDWDIALPGWTPDWFGNNGRSTLVPLLTQPGPGSNDFGGYDSKTVDSDVSKALVAPTTTKAASLWADADKAAMKDVAVVPMIETRWPMYHSTAVQGCSFWAMDLNCDPTNVWLKQ